jgi:hypothetical protein
MTSVSTTRRCGNCGGAVDTADVVCPHCDALLAAYEAPAGATSGTAAAVMPVDTSTPVPAPPTHETPSPVDAPAAASPIATAVAETREAAEETQTGMDAPDGPADDRWPLSSQPARETLAETVNLGDLPEPVAAIIPAPAPTTAPGPVREALGNTKAKIDAQPTATAVSTPAAASKPAPRPTPLARPTLVRMDAEPIPESVRRMREQRRDAWTTKAPDKKAKSRSEGASLIVIIFAIFIFLRVAGSNAFFGTVLTLGAVAFVIWFIMRLANATGRKTTHMPWDDQWRRRR